MLEAVKTGSGEGAVTGRSSRRRIFRLPAAWCRCGIGFTRNLLVGLGHGICVGRSNVPETPGDFEFSLTDHAIRASDHAWLRASAGSTDLLCFTRRRLLPWVLSRPSPVGVHPVAGQRRGGPIGFVRGLAHLANGFVRRAARGRNWLRSGAYPSCQWLRLGAARGPELASFGGLPSLPMASFGAAAGANWLRSGRWGRGSSGQVF